jgi:hypothetical protein
VSPARCFAGEKQQLEKSEPAKTGHNCTWQLRFSREHGSGFFKFLSFFLAGCGCADHVEFYRLLRLQFLEDPTVGSIATRAKTEVIDDPRFNLPGIGTQNPELPLERTPPSLRVREVLGQMLPRQPKKNLVEGVVSSPAFWLFLRGRHRGTLLTLLDFVCSVPFVSVREPC